MRGGAANADARSPSPQPLNRPAGRKVLECASPLALFDGPGVSESGRGLPHSKTLARGSSSQSAAFEPWWISLNRPAGREVLECASPLALFDGPGVSESGRGLPHSKTLARGSSSQSAAFEPWWLPMNQNFPAQSVQFMGAFLAHGENTPYPLEPVRCSPDPRSQKPVPE